MVASAARNWNLGKFSLRTLLVATLWLCSVLAMYRYARNAGQEAGFQQRVSSRYSEKYAVGDLLKRHTPEQLTAKIQSLSPFQWWDEREGAASVTYRPYHDGSGVSITYFEADESFEIYHAGTTHDEIEKLFAELRSEAARGLHPASLR